MDGAEFKKNKSGSEIILPPILDLGQAESLWLTFGQALDHGGDVELNAGQVERLSTAPIQVILSAASALEKDNSKIQLKNPSDAFLTGVSDLGLESVFVKWSDA